MKTPLLLCLLALATAAPTPAANDSPEPNRPVARPFVLQADDVRAFPLPPDGFDKPDPRMPHGTVEVFEYDSAVTGTRRKANVYLPAGYSTSRRYPVLYLLHGIAGNHAE